MQDQEIIRRIEAKEQAYEAMREIVHRKNIDVMIANMGTHLAMWVCWSGRDGSAVTRQFSWSKENPGRDGVRLQWIYDAFYKYGELQKMIQHTTWRNEDQENTEVLIQV